MPLIIEGPVPSRWSEKSSAPGGAIYRGLKRTECVSLALINNMPDAALEDTELQFFELLDIASGDVPVVVKLYSLTGVPRTDRGQRHLNEFYFSLDELWNNRFDGIIVTGTEPRQPELPQEPYWPALTSVLDWAERNTFSTVLSCLAAHAGVLHSDGIPRHRMSDKQFGVFDFTKNTAHPLIAGTEQVRFPHSRWNELKAEALIACGYTVLTQSAEGGVDTFVKKKKQSLFVHFQGHPEYGSQTLLKEYRRDIRRFLRGERESYPPMPKGYFDPKAATALTEFQNAALRDPRDEQLELFPEAITKTVQSTWQSSATSIYRNWLQYVRARREEASPFAPLASSYVQGQRKRSAVI
jgi:homoserine O-succinyltransferase